MNRLIAGLALTALIASPALARTHSHAHASGASNYVRSVPVANDFARGGYDPAGYYDGHRLADPDPFIRNQLIRQYEAGEP